MDSRKISDSTSTPKDFRQLGISDGYKLKPPFLKEVKLPSKNTDKLLFTEHHKLELKGGDRKKKQINQKNQINQKKQQQKQKQQKINLKAPFKTTDSSFADFLQETISNIDSMEFFKDIDIQDYFPKVEMYNPQEFKRDLNGLHGTASSADISMKSFSMECEPDIDYQNLHKPEEFKRYFDTLKEIVSSPPSFPNLMENISDIDFQNLFNAEDYKRDLDVLGEIAASAENSMKSFPEDDPMVDIDYQKLFSSQEYEHDLNLFNEIASSTGSSYKNIMECLPNIDYQEFCSQQENKCDAFDDIFFSSAKTSVADIDFKNLFSPQEYKCDVETLNEIAASYKNIMECIPYNIDYQEFFSQQENKRDLDAFNDIALSTDISMKSFSMECEPDIDFKNLFSPEDYKHDIDALNNIISSAETSVSDIDFQNLFNPQEYKRDVDVLNEIAASAEKSLKSFSDVSFMDMDLQNYIPKVELYSPEEYNLDLRSYDLNTTSSANDMATLANNALNDINFQEDFPDVKLFSPQEYNFEMETNSLEEFDFDMKAYFGNFNPWQSKK